MNSQSSALGFHDGAQLAVQLLAELRGRSDDESCLLESQLRAPGAAQRNIVFEYLDAMRATSSRAVEEGFAAVLSDYIASCAIGCVPDPELYERLSNAR